MNGSIVVRTDTEGTLREHTAILQVGLSALLVQDVQQHAIFSLRRHDDHVLEVLGTGPDERDAADVYLLDDVGLAGTTGHGLLKGVQIDDDQVYLWNVVLLHLLPVAFVVTTGQDASEHLRMQCLHTATQNTGIGCHLFHLLTGVALLFNELLRAACRQEANALSIELFQQLVQPVLMEDWYERRLHLLRFSHSFFLLYNVINLIQAAKITKKCELKSYSWNIF